MTTKLNWQYDNASGEYRAEHKGLVIRAVHDDCPENPFKIEDGHWPMLARPGGRNERTVEYDKQPGLALGSVLGRFSDAHIVFDQKALAQILAADTSLWADWHEQDKPKWVTDAGALRAWFEDALYDMSNVGSERFDTLAELYKLLGIPCLRTTVTGYSQGAWAELLIVATPEAQAALRTRPEDMSDDDWAKTLEADMQAQADLYKAWAFGDVYGYVVCRPVLDEDGEVIELEDLDSCWGYYDSDFDTSGLEEAALSAAEHQLAKENV